MADVVKEKLDTMYGKKGIANQMRQSEVLINIVKNQLQDEYFVLEYRIALLYSFIFIFQTITNGLYNVSNDFNIFNFSLTQINYPHLAPFRG